MKLERRILLEAVVVSVLGHAIFFNVFTIREPEARRAPGAGLPAIVPITQAEPADLMGTRATADPAAADSDVLASVELERRMAAPKVELERTTFVWEDEPSLAPPAVPGVGPPTWRFAKEPGVLRDEFPADYDAGASLSEVRETLLGLGPAQGMQRTIPFTVPFRKVPGAGVLRIGPEAVRADDVRFVTGQIRIDLATRKVEVMARPSGDPEIDAAFAEAVRKWQFNLERTGTLSAWLRLPASVRAREPVRTPPSADDVLDEASGAAGEGP